MKKVVVIEHDTLVELTEAYKQACKELASEYEGTPSDGKYDVNKKLMSSVYDALKECNTDPDYNLLVKHDIYEFYVSEEAYLNGAETIGYHMHNGNKMMIKSYSEYGVIIRRLLMLGKYSRVNDLTNDELAEIEDGESTADTLVQTLAWHKISEQGAMLLERGWGLIQTALAERDIAQGE